MGGLRGGGGGVSAGGGVASVRWARLRLTRSLHGLLAATLGLAFALLIANGLSRSLIEDRWAEDLVYISQADPPVHRPAGDGDLLIELRPGSQASFLEQCSWCDDPREVSINSSGLRGPEVTAASLRVLALGGSFTYGAGVSDERTWPMRLEERLRSRGHDWRVLNGGVSSYTSRQKLRQLELYLPAWKPDLVLMQVHNQGPRAVLPEQAANTGARWRAQQGALEENLDLPPSLAPGPHWIWRTSLGRALLYARERRVRAARGGAITPRTAARAGDATRAPWERRIRHLEPPVVVFRPPAGGGEAWWGDVGALYLDLVSRAPRDIASWTNIHPGAEAYDWVAGELYRWLDEAGCWGSLEAGAGGVPCRGN